MGFLKPLKMSSTSKIVEEIGEISVFDTVALVGATGAVGRIMLELLEERELFGRQFRFLASKRSAGSAVTFRGTDYVVEELTKEAFAGVDLVISSTPDDVARDYLPSAVAAGATVIDESGYFRMRPEVALVIPEINPQAALTATGIISSPNCATTQLALALKPLHDAARVLRVIVSTYQAVSGAGLQGNTDLLEGTKAQLNGHEYQCQAFAHPIAFNAIPQV